MYEWFMRLMGLPKDDPGTVTYSLPGAPPSEHRVRDAKGRIFARERNLPDDGYSYGPWGSWVQIGDGENLFPAELFHDEPFQLRYAWGPLLHFGPLTLIPFTEQEKAVAAVYGPPGARWGSPGTPCPYEGCALSVGHIGAHRGPDGSPLGVTMPDGSLVPFQGRISPHEAAEFPCTCGHPGQHRPGCTRYSRLTGGSDGE